MLDHDALSFSLVPFCYGVCPFVNQLHPLPSATSGIPANMSIFGNQQGERIRCNHAMYHFYSKCLFMQKSMVSLVQYLGPQYIGETQVS